jgi:hypothetical protein
MLRLRIFRARTAALLAFGLIFAAIGYAAASANAVATSSAGDGRGAITSYTLDTTSIQVTLDKDNDPTLILKVRFAITPAGSLPAPKTVKAGFLGGGGALLGGWYGACTNIGGTTWECLPSGTAARVETGIQLRVIAAQ